jgi:hypothetical protein
MNSIQLIKHNYNLSTRKYTLSKNNNYKIPSVGLIQSFKILNYNDLCDKYLKNKDLSINNFQLKPSLIIGNFTIVPSDLNSNLDSNLDSNLNSSINDIISIKDIRNYIRNIDYPETDYHNQLLNFENYLFSQQLKSTEYYYTINNKDLQNSIFNSGVNVYIEMLLNNSKISNNYDNSNYNRIDDDLLIEETYWDKIYDNDNKK